jgi:mannose-6-phosphate isomerase
MKLSGVTKSPIWGGTRLIRDWSKPSTCDTVGESWELTVRKNEVCTVQNGAYSGASLSDLIARFPGEIMGASTLSNGEFPLLVKLIDAADRLSVQVHPDDDYAARVENDRGKTEMWYIVDADEDAEIICGLAEGYDNAAYQTALARGELMSALRTQRVKAGETYFIPAGLPHAIGKGILIAEIQQNCDLTYRVYDYERRGADGSLRELHVDKALDVTVPFTEDEVNAIRYEAGAADTQTLAHCRYFKTEKLTVNAPTALTVDERSFAFLLSLEGEGTITAGGMTCPVARADGYYLPAGLGEVTLDGNMTVLVARMG